MKRVLLYFFIALLLVGLIGCQTSDKKTKLQETLSQSTEKASLDRLTCSYEIKPTEKWNSTETAHVVYPQLFASTDYTTVNSLIEQETDTWINEAYTSNAHLTLDYFVTFCDDTCLCLLFEGDIMDKTAAHPTNVAFSICVSLTDNKIVDPLDLVAVDEVFISKFNKQLAEQEMPTRFTDEQWKEIVEYFNKMPDSTLLRNIESGVLAITQEGVIVCVSVPHSLGDYIKVEVPVAWYGTQN